MIYDESLILKKNNVFVKSRGVCIWVQVVVFWNGLGDELKQSTNIHTCLKTIQRNYINRYEEGERLCLCLYLFCNPGWIFGL